MDADGSRAQLYDFRDGFGEQSNVASRYPEIAARLRSALLDWWRSLPTLM